MSTLENTPYGCAVDVARAISAMRGRRFSRIEWLDVTGSTNTDLMDAARSGDGERVLGALEQTAGRGRLDRSWVAPAGSSLLCSVLVRPAVGLDRAHLLTASMGLAALDACELVAGVAAGLKWPNDLVIEQRKLGGILAESVMDASVLEAVVIGLGLNVEWPDELPADIADTATSLDRFASAPTDPTDLVIGLLSAFERWLVIAESEQGPREIREAVLRRSATIGRTVRVDLGASQLVGTAVDLELDGRLVVEADGRRHTISVGDVVHLRPAD